MTTAELEALALSRGGSVTRVKDAALPGPAKMLTEKEFMAAVVALARSRGWLTYHTRDSRGSDAGFFDLVIVRERIVFVELKNMTGRLTVDQERWREAIRVAGGTYFLWRPCDWDTIREILK